ncbi:NADH:ubiquinone oxidoreductase subunit 4 (chain M) [Antiquaquibacter soli]|uniref:NADH:ubiquinone oxidoreductase subunit 4 (Chain M) n=1 Tax=Antiquaquibacter soli TaxID=3064523 RepID=A0ABT9BQ87_9MICO|nr:NADH:ubiquinone oxidoreductase subunit 4 (chain M) [Protaetiibacter sp. WY-16]MDO7881590.1 NADH:ubiquinone oxidoreductase subunit 4 (chain M) [Protaetiibacter sp. WY-16]
MRTRIAIAVAAVLFLLVGGGAVAIALITESPSLHAGEGRSIVEEDDDFGTVEVYTVLDDGSLDPEADGLTAEVWETFVRVATLDFAAEVMAEYRAGDAPDSDTLAYVYQTDDPDYWVLAANLATSSDSQQLIATLIHEYAHIITLDTTQIGEQTSTCETFQLSEGCPEPDSLLVAFEERFWSPYGDAAPDADNDDADAAWDFYLEHEEDFVSDYAATNVVEDIAESFMTFVLEDEPEGDSVAAQKLAFFWNEPDLVAIRERIRTEFGDDLGLAD